MFDITVLYEPKTIPEAAATLKAHPGAVLIAGGSDVLIKIRAGELAGRELVSIQHLDELRGVSLDKDGTLRIGALTSFSALEKDELIKRHLCALGEAAATVGGPQIRNGGTIGGNVCNGAPSADTAATLAAYDAALEYTGVEGTRRALISEHYVGAGKTSRKPDEILTAILIAKESYEQTKGAYFKYAMREAMDIATLSCSANLRFSQDGAAIERLRLAFGVAAPVPVRAVHAEALAKGRPLDEALIDAVARAVPEDINPRDSWRASREFRMQIALELTRRAIRKAAGQAL